MLHSCDHFGRRFSRRTNPQQRRRVQLRLEELESRTLLSASDPVAVPLIAILPAAGSNPTSPGYSPAQISHIYGFSQAGSDGTGQTIAIVDAYNDPNIVSDLATFDANSGLTDPPLAVEDQNGNPINPASTSVPSNSGWGLEISLDVEWAHAMAPGATILLVEANSASFSDLMKAVDTAAGSANVVSMSWGANEFSGEKAYDSHFNVPGVTFVASSGDTGAVVEYPAVSPYVVAVGGTTLTYSNDGSGNAVRASETGWSGSGGGVSAVEAKPSYQSGLSYSRRAVPDVAYDANPTTGFGVYDTYGYSGWVQVGGTSAGAPQWTGLFALVNQQRTAAGRGSLSSTETLSDLYKTLPRSDLYDITSGSTSHGFTRLNAGSGYDLVTGLGSPQASLLIPGLSQLGGGTARTLKSVQPLSGSGSAHVAIHLSGDASIGTAGNVAPTQTVGVNRVQVSDPAMFSHAENSAMVPDSIAGNSPNRVAWSSPSTPSTGSQPPVRVDRSLAGDSGGTGGESLPGFVLPSQPTGSTDGASPSAPVPQDDATRDDQSAALRWRQAVDMCFTETALFDAESAPVDGGWPASTDVMVGVEATENCVAALVTLAGVVYGAYGTPAENETPRPHRSVWPWQR
jgi:hypothetical protein